MVCTCLGIHWKQKTLVKFKIDTGCNTLVLSHSTLKSLGYSAKQADLSKLPPVKAALASGEEHMFRKLGAVSLFRDDKQAIQICKADSICHSTHETNDLLGTEVLRQFSGVSFDLTANKYMELKK